jgi:hypothetical protein
MKDGDNRHPADRLSDVRAQIKELEQEESSLRSCLLRHPDDLIGSEHIALVSSILQARRHGKPARGGRRRRNPPAHDDHPGHVRPIPKLSVGSFKLLTKIPDDINERKITLKWTLI